MVTLLDRFQENRRQVLSILLPCMFAAASGPAYADDTDRIRGFLRGVASWYGNKFHGRKTASGQIFNQNDFTCAHKTLPFGTHLLVKNPATGLECEVVVNDRGPYHGRRVLDLSRAAAHKIGISGVASVVYRTGRYVAKKIDDLDDNKVVKVAAVKPSALDKSPTQVASAKQFSQHQTDKNGLELASAQPSVHGQGQQVDVSEDDGAHKIWTYSADRSTLEVAAEHELNQSESESPVGEIASESIPLVERTRVQVATAESDSLVQ